MPIAVTGLLREIKAFERIACEAAYKCSKSLAYLAMCINPLNQDDKVSKKMVDELFEAHIKYLQDYQ